LKARKELRKKKKIEIKGIKTAARVEILSERMTGKILGETRECMSTERGESSQGRGEDSEGWRKSRETAKNTGRPSEKKKQRRQNG